MIWCPRILLLLVPVWLVSAAAATAAGPQEGSAGPVTRGTKIYAGSFSFSSAGEGFYENAAGDRTQEWTVRPGGAVFVADGLAMGFHLEGRWFTQGEIRRISYSMGPVLEYYWDTTGGDEPAGRVLPYLGGGYLWGQTRDESPAGNTKHNSGMVSLNAGLAWLLSDQVAADIAVNYRTGRFIEKVPRDGPESRADRWTLLIGFKAFVSP
jgi:hypothetical protein